MSETKEKATEEILLEYPNGMQFVYRKCRDRANISIRNKITNSICEIFRFNNVPIYEHPYLSLENLNCCGSWSFDKTYLETEAVQTHKKLVVDLNHVTNKKIDIDKWYESLLFDTSEVDVRKTVIERSFGNRIYNIIVARKGCLADYFDMDEILSVYKCHNIRIRDKERLIQLWHVPLIELYTEVGISKYAFDFRNVIKTEDCIINGLALGYPIESTVGFLHNIEKARRKGYLNEKGQ